MPEAPSTLFPVPESLPRPSWTARRCFGHAEIPAAAASEIDRILTFHDLDPTQIRRDYIDTCRRNDLCRLSWIRSRSELQAAQTFRHELVRFAFDDIIVRSGKTLLIESPFRETVEVIAYRLALEPGATVIVEAPLILTVGQVLALRDARSAYADRAQPARILYRASGGRPGTAGQRGADGAMGSRDAPDGIAASPGLTGSDGSDGADLADQRFFAYHLAGNLDIALQAGRGGDGGTGGDGGDGGRGHSISFFDMGRGGNGGAGGTGGAGGRGGDGGRLTLGLRARAPGSRLKIDTIPAMGGAGGAGGLAGSGGLGSPDGLPGVPGPLGVPGPSGTTPSIFWTEGKDLPDA